MCGIAGVLQFGSSSQHRRNLSLETLTKFGHSFSHRGPDDAGWLISSTDSKTQPPTVTDRLELPTGSAAPQAVLAHRRLSILDLSKNGFQPMWSADHQQAMIFNGEIYNYREIRARLEKKGIQFKSSGDSEVLLEAYQQEGSSVLNELVGMFAFCVYDWKQERVFLARDFFGIKPLYWTVDPENKTFAFASEIKTLLTLPWVSKKVHPERLFAYLTSGITNSTTDTLYQGIYSLAPGHFLELDLRSTRASVEPKKFWSLQPENLTAQDISFEDAAKKVREIFLKNIELHLRSDVPVGAALSGGIDSSAIVAGMRHVGGSSLQLHAFSYIADDEKISEENWAELAASESQAIRHTIQPTAEELLRDLDTLIATQDEPFGSTSIYAQYRVFKLAREHGIKVMLDGQGADEILAGYGGYGLAKLTSDLRNGRIQNALQFLRSAQHVPQKKWMLVGALRHSIPGIPDSLETTLRALLGKPLVPTWLDPQWFRAQGLNELIPSKNHVHSGRDPLRQELISATTQMHLPMLLRYEDHNSMAHSLESRVPFLTPELAQFVISLPEEYLLSSDGTSKAVFRKAMQGIVPDAILQRRDKIGFQTPENRWLATLKPWIDQVLHSPIAKELPFFHHAEILKEWDAVLSGQSRFDFRVWRWLNVIRWIELKGIEL